MKPDLLFIIGPSCSGKSSMANVIRQQDPSYQQLDDVTPLYQIFHADELLHEKRENDFHKFINENNLTAYYDTKNPVVYSIPNLAGGYQILNPAVWNIVLSILGTQIKSAKCIIEFSRGSDHNYNQMFNVSDDAVYKKSFDCLCADIPQTLLNKAMIIDINAPLDIRRQRNIVRFHNGGHLVSEKTMDTVYKQDVFLCGSAQSVNIKGCEIPVFFIKNDMNSANMNVFLIQEFKKSLIYYRSVKK